MGKYVDRRGNMKKGRKTALRVLDTLGGAEAWAGDKECYIEYRPGEDRKCMDYCRVNAFCNYYRDEIARR